MDKPKRLFYIYFYTGQLSNLLIGGDIMDYKDELIQMINSVEDTSLLKYLYDMLSYIIKH